MQKRLLLCLILTGIFWVFWINLGRKLGYTVEDPSPQHVEEFTDPPEIVKQEVAAEKVVALDPVEPVPNVAQQYDVLENDVIQITLDNKGGVIRDAILKEYFKSAERLEPVDLIFSDENFPAELVFDDGKSDADWLYSVEKIQNQVSYRYRRGGWTVSKTFTLSDRYVLDCVVNISEPSSTTFQMVVAEGLEPIAPGEKLTPSIWSMGAINPKMMFYTWSEGGDHEKEPMGKGSRDKFEPLLEEENSVEWAGVKDNYFANVFLPDKPLRNVYGKVHDIYPGSEPVPLPVVAIAGEKTINGSFYLGPMVKKELDGMDPRLSNLITYGWAGALSKWLFSGLNIAHSMTNNWGWAIVLLTFFIRLLMVPLTIPSVKSSFKMKKIQPKIEKLKQKFPNSDLENKQKLSQATFELYRKEGVNPFSSCITALAQMPVFFAYFSLLRTSMTLRQADWLMINDLSAKDSTFILPILMGVTMFFSTLAMPMPSADPAQAKMMKFMPVIFSLMFVFMPAGLILYMITSNLFTMIQTKVLKRRFDK